MPVAKHERFQLVETLHAERLALRVHGSNEEIDLARQNTSTFMERNWAQKFTAWDHTPVERRSDKQPRRPHYSALDWRDANGSNPYRESDTKVVPDILVGIRTDRQKQERMLYSKTDFFQHLIQCNKAQDLFKKEYEDSIASGEKLLAWFKGKCHLACHEFSQKEPDPPTLRQSNEVEGAARDAASRREHRQALIPLTREQEDVVRDRVFECFEDEKCSF
ncbi:uncharacterized protein PAC_12634 [Phialocephala subalpina]|uniref:Uncharacterized protein n=1 Tax=Phialocephala subalpina TaxID=576137 RepID=A0A1L7XCP6_9HELO|nr:uncharacterized protein PAC_12634 [Phialocephala subalpina]